MFSAAKHDNSSEGYPLTVKLMTSKCTTGEERQHRFTADFLKLDGRAIRIKDTMSETQPPVRSC
jgi:hypothetical protein